MGDDAQTYDEAHEVLRQIIAGTNYAPLFIAARKMKRMLDDDLSITMELKGRLSIDGEEDPDAVKNRRVITKRMADASAKAIRKERETTDPKYKTPVFQCHADYEKCAKSSSPKLCMALFVICLGKHLLPFVHHAK